MKTENSEGYKMIQEGAEVYLNGTHLGNGVVEYEVETPYEEVRSDEWDLGFQTEIRPVKHTFKITMPEGSNALQGDWIIKRHAPNGDVKEETFSGQEEARNTMQALRQLGLEGHFELVCRPRAEDVVVASYRNQPEKEPLDKPKKEEDDGFDREKSYRDDSGDIWSYLYEPGERFPGWYFQEWEGGPHYGPFPDPLLGPHEEVKSEEGAISDPQELLRSKQYLDSYGCVWGFRIHQGNDSPDWHYRPEGSRDWDPFPFHTPVDGPWTEYKGED